MPRIILYVVKLLMAKKTMYVTRIEPAGAGGATGGHFQLRRHQLGRGGRWCRSRHLRRVQRPRQGAPENVHLPLRKSVAEPIF